MKNTSPQLVAKQTCLPLQCMQMEHMYFYRNKNTYTIRVAFSVCLAIIIISFIISKYNNIFKML